MVFCGTMLAGCTDSSEVGQERSLAVYSFSGENKYFAVSNGVLILTPTEEIFYGGDLEETPGEFDDITEYTMTFYVASGDEKNILMSNGATDETGSVIDISGSTGQRSGASLIKDDTRLNNNLYCELKTTDLNGEKNEYQLQLTLTEITGKSEN